MQVHPEFSQGFHCCDLVCEIVPVDDSSGEGVSVNLTGGWFSLGRACVLHGLYCLHSVGNSPSSCSLTDG